ncbi:MAG: chorismate synthase [Bdellovibrionaceae bacterium]|nr:chorismate synthase [Pseudobdellovibrionaceae bacterium]
MAGSTFGQVFRVTTFGESHGAVIGAVIDGCPAGLEIDLEFIQAQLDKRKPGQSRLTTQRKESDQAKILSGVFENKSTGAPLAMIIENEDNRSKDYDHLAEVFRPSHADYTSQMKFGHRDHRAGVRVRLGEERGGRARRFGCATGGSDAGARRLRLHDGNGPPCD